MTLINGLARLRDNRSLQGPLPPGPAPYTRSDFFKSPSSGTRPKALRWDHRLSNESHNLQPSPLKAASRGPAQKLISLGTARPAPDYFPLESMMLECMQNATTKTEGASITSTMSTTKGESAYDLAVAMNYGYSAGSPQALRFITEHAELVHKPPYDDWSCSLTCGTTSAIEIAFRIFYNPGDTILVEEYTYSGTMIAAKAQGLRLLGIEMDDLGLLPDALWDCGRGQKPFVLYMIPTGQNPIGTTQSLERRKAIYDVAERHDIYILEDDPYYFLQLGGACSESIPGQDGHPAEGYLQTLPASHVSMDTSGRVLRMDTTSKILPGLRCGWVTGCAQIIDKFVAYSEVGVLSPSGPSQVMVYKLLDETWGHEGFFNWLRSLSAQYRNRRDTLVDACRRFLPSDVCQWIVPEEGMFIWIRIDVSGLSGTWDLAWGDDERGRCCRAAEDRVYQKAQDNGVLVSKGSWFISDVQKMRNAYFRLTFAAAPSGELGEAIARFALAVRSELLPSFVESSGAV
ncbi:aromatic aminotransferase [Colletotrichum plurivorum]|uniref:Aromatic aminotransferase n=1 Tax=Colletotrichum plurivorum TaxID=2175906 RepID=A0A8H6KD51_9PEZI|nr:aromatic aminotransferase [Colletotrichum plurivorum]